MNDDDLMTAVRKPFTGIQMTTPVGQITRRGHTIRARRRLPGVAAAAAAAAAAGVLAVTALPHAGNQAGSRPPGSVQLAAWTVTEHAGGRIDVTLRELRDAARLQATLRADGVPASVTFGAGLNPSCREYPGRWRLGESGIHLSNAGPSIITIDPAALPHGAGVWLSGRMAVEYQGPDGRHVIAPAIPPGMHPKGGVKPVPVIVAGLVQTSPSCTGS